MRNGNWTYRITLTAEDSRYRAVAQLDDEYDAWSEGGMSFNTETAARECGNDLKEYWEKDLKGKLAIKNSEKS